MRTPREILFDRLRGKEADVVDVNDMENILAELRGMVEKLRRKKDK